MEVVVIHVGKLFTEARQLSIPGQEARWVSKRLAWLFKTGKLIGFTQSPSGDWVKINVKTTPTKLIIRGVSPEKAAEISAAFWRMLSEETR